MNNLIVNLPLTCFFAFWPSFLWLNFYLRKDTKPEPKGLILKVFLLGMLLSLPAALVEIAALSFFEKLKLPLLFEIFLGVALIEEMAKFLVVRLAIFNSPELEEPVDTMIYMICAALGFGGAENLLLITSMGKTLPLAELAQVSILRFVGATFLHAIASGLVGFFIGLSFFRKKERIKLISFGIILATLLHGFYNFFILKIEERLGIVLAGILIALSAFFLSFAFSKLKGKYG